MTIVGIGPANYRGTVDIGLGTDFWLPITALPATEAPGMRGAATIHAPLLVKARLREGIAVAQAATAMDVLGRRLDAELPDDIRHEGEFALGRGITVVASTDVRVHPQADAAITALASLVLVIVALVLAIACSNLATLLLVRGAARAREVAVRLAMGARRHDLVRQLLIESLLLALAGGVIGCVLAWWGIRAAGDRPPGEGRSESRLQRARLCHRALGGHRRGVRSGAGAQGHEGRAPVDTARRGASVDRSSAAHPEERIDRLSGGGLRAVPRRHEHLPAAGRGGTGSIASAMP